MKDSDSAPQLPLPAMASATGAQVIRLPLPTPPGVQPDARPAPRHTIPLPRPRPALWYALYFPQLDALPPAKQKKALAGLAHLAQDISSTVSLHACALVCEVRSSLRYFGGIDSIHKQLKGRLQQHLLDHELPDTYCYASAPTVTGSLLLARAGHNALVYQKNILFYIDIEPTHSI